MDNGFTISIIYVHSFVFVFGCNSTGAASDKPEMTSVFMDFVEATAARDFHCGNTYNACSEGSVESGLYESKLAEFWS